MVHNMEKHECMWITSNITVIFSGEMVLNNLPKLAAMAAALPAASPFTISLINHAALLAGLYIGIVACTKRLLAVKAIVAAEGDVHSDHAGDDKAPARSSARTILRLMVPHLIFALAYAAIFAAYQITNKTRWIDIIPSLLIFLFLLMFFDATLGVLFSSTSFVCRPPVSLEQGKRDFIFFARRGEYAAWPKVSGLLAGGIMFAVSAEFTVVLPLMGFAVLVAMGQGWFQPESNARVRDVVRYTAMYTAVMWTLVGGTLIYDAMTKHLPKDVTPQQHSNGTVIATPLPDASVTSGPFEWVNYPSDWILRSIQYYISIAAILGPLSLLSLNFRFDRSRARHLTPPVAINGSCDLPRSVGAFSKPTFYAGFTALTAVLVWFDYVADSPCAPKATLWLAHSALVFVSIPAVILASGLTACIRGELKEWWAYEEAWGVSGTSTPGHKGEKPVLDETNAEAA